MRVDAPPRLSREVPRRGVEGRCGCPSAETRERLPNRDHFSEMLVSHRRPRAGLPIDIGQVPANQFDAIDAIELALADYQLLFGHPTQLDPDERNSIRALIEGALLRHQARRLAQTS